MGNFEPHWSRFLHPLISLLILMTFLRCLEWGKWVIWIKLPKIYATLYLMTHSKDICEMISVIMGYNWQISVTFKFSNKVFEENLAIYV